METRQHIEIEQQMQNKDNLVEVMPESLHIHKDGMPSLIMEYLNYDMRVQPLGSYNNKFTMFGKDIAKVIYQKAFDIAQNLVLKAAPLDELEAKIRENPSVLTLPIEIAGMQGTLAQLAAINLDTTLTNGKGLKAEGMTERLLSLHRELLPETAQQAVNQVNSAMGKDARRVAKLEDLLNFWFLEPNEIATFLKQAGFEECKKTYIEIEKSWKLRVDTIHKALDMIRRGEPGANILIQKYLDTIKPKIITNNGYFLHILRVMARADKLVNFWFNNEDEPLARSLANKFCIEVIGTLQNALPVRVHQYLVNGIYYFFYGNKMVKRVTDLEDLASHSFIKPNVKLGTDYYFNKYGYSLYIENGMFEDLWELFSLSNIPGETNIKLNDCMDGDSPIPKTTIQSSTYLGASREKFTETKEDKDMQRTDLTYIDRICETDARFRKASPDELKKDIHAVAISYVKIPDSDLREYGLDLGRCKRIEHGIHNILIVYGRNIKDNDNYVPKKDFEKAKSPDTAINTSHSALNLFNLKDDKRENKDSIKIFSFREDILSKDKWLPWDMYLNMMRRKKEKDDCELYDARDASKNSFENLSAYSARLLDKFKSGIYGALKDNTYGVMKNLEMAEDPDNQNDFTSDDIRELMQYIKEIRSHIASSKEVQGHSSLSLGK